MRQDVLPQTERHLLGLRIPRCQTQKVRMVAEDPEQEGNWHWQDQIPQDRFQSVQESDQGKKLIVYLLNITTHACSLTLIIL